MLSEIDKICPTCSMGGSVAVHVAAKKVLRSLAGLVVIDVVEVRIIIISSCLSFNKLTSNFCSLMGYKKADNC